MSKPPPTVDAMSVRCSCGFTRAVPSPNDFLDVFAEVSAHLAKQHASRRGVSIVMQLNVAENVS